MVRVWQIVYGQCLRGRLKTHKTVHKSTVLRWCIQSFEISSLSHPLLHQTFQFGQSSVICLIQITSTLSELSHYHSDID